MIFITPMGGHGSVYLTKCFNMLVRPDTIFGSDPDILIRQKDVSAEWERRAGCRYNDKMTLEDNLMRMVFEHKYTHILLSGRCSIKHPFLTRNRLGAFCLVRHPLHAYVSLFKTQHPETIKHLGGFNTEAAVRYWAGQWNAIVSDFISSGNQIYHFESLKTEVEGSWLSKHLKGWDGSKRNHNKLSPDLERLLENLVANNFKRIYSRWNGGDFIT